MNDDDPQNLIARGRILLSVSSKLLTQIKSHHVAYYMLQTLKEKCKIQHLKTLDFLVYEQ